MYEEDWKENYQNLVYLLIFVHEEEEKRLQNEHFESGKNFTSFSGAKFLRCNQKTPKIALNSLNYERNLILIHFQCHTMKLLWMWLTCLLIVYCRHRKLVFFSFSTFFIEANSLFTCQRAHKSSFNSESELVRCREVNYMAVFSIMRLFTGNFVMKVSKLLWI